MEAELEHYDKIYMSRQELEIRLKRMGGENLENITMLAELNGCTVNEMYICLGLRKPPKPKPKPLDRKLLRDMYKRRMNDAEISSATGYTKTRIRNWRLENNLPAIRKIVG